MHRTDWFHQAGWGIFVHYLAAPAGSSGGAEISAEAWNRRVESVDVEGLADQAQASGAGYLFLTLGQNSGHYCSPNATYDRLVGIRPSKCSRRDLPAELAVALERRGLRLLVYLPSGAPEFDAVAAEKLQWRREGGRFAEFQRKWEQVIREWSLRWGSAVHGWWIDGCYWCEQMYRHAEEPNFGSFAAALRAGNAASLVAWNPGVKYPITGVAAEEDYTAGEVNQPQEIDCPGRWVGRSQFHMLSYLGSDWGRAEPRFSDEQVIEYTRSIVDYGGVVSWDVPVQSNGLIVPRFMDQLRAIGRAVSGARGRRAEERGAGEPVLAPPRRVRVAVEVVEAPVLDVDGRPAGAGRVRIGLANPWSERIAGQVQIGVEPAGAGRVFSEGVLAYALEPGQTLNGWVSVEVAAEAAQKALRLQVRRPGDARVFSYALPVRQEMRLHCLPAADVTDLAAALAAEPRWVVKAGQMCLAELRLATMDDDLAISAVVVERKRMQSPLMWDASCIEIFAASGRGEGIRQLLLVPRTPQEEAKAAMVVEGRGQVASEVGVLSRAEGRGYSLVARIPLAMLGVSGQRGKRQFLLECSVTASPAGDVFQRATLFGSQNAAGNDVAYAKAQES